MKRQKETITEIRTPGLAPGFLLWERSGLTTTLRSMHACSVTHLLLRLDKSLLYKNIKTAEEGECGILKGQVQIAATVNDLQQLLAVVSGCQAAPTAVHSQGHHHSISQETIGP